MTWFKEDNQADAKRRYSMLMAKHHPDHGGDRETALEILAEYRALPEKAQKESKADEALKAQMSSADEIEGIHAEMCGTWVWVTGQTWEARKKLKDLGFRFSKQKKAWYWSAGTANSKGKRKARFKNMPEVRTAYGSQAIELDEAAQAIAG